MQLLNDIIATLPDGDVIDVRIGLHWTAVVAAVGGERRCGLASTLAADHGQHGTADVPESGKLQRHSMRELAQYAQRREQPTLASVGIAAINALLPHQPDRWIELNAADVIAEQGFNRRVALIGSFPFVTHLRDRVGKLTVLEYNPQPGELPATAAPDVLPHADVVAITGMTLQNHTLAQLLPLCSPEAYVIMLGPSTPLSPVLFDYGIDVLSGAIVADIDAVLQGVSQGAVFRQLHALGVRLVNIRREG